MSDFEREDLELKAMMGNQFIDVTEPISEAKPCKNTREKKGPVTHHTDVLEDLKVRDAEWHPTKQRTWMDDLKDCTKSTMIFGGLNVLLWWWQMAGLVDESVGQPCMWVCFALAGIGIGKVLGGKR
jgi:hypothetical protein